MDLKKALEQAAPSASGKKQIIIEVPKQADAASYEVALPMQSLKGQQSFVLSLKTEQAVLQIPSNLLSNVTDNSEYASIRIARASTEGLDAAASVQIGSRPANRAEDTRRRAGFCME